MSRVKVILRSKFNFKVVSRSKFKVKVTLRNHQDNLLFCCLFRRCTFFNFDFQSSLEAVCECRHKGDLLFSSDEGKTWRRGLYLINSKDWLYKIKSPMVRGLICINYLKVGLSEESTLLSNFDSS